MSRVTLFAIPLFLVVACPALAQQTPTKVSSTTVNSASQNSTATPKPFSSLSPRDAAEMRADILMARKEYSDAAGLYMQILVNEPKNAALMNKVGVAFQQLGDLDRSEREACQRNGQQQPAQIGAHERRAAVGVTRLLCIRAVQQR